MGAWGIGSFENDQAGDWIYDLEEADDWGLVQTTLQKILDGDDEDACEALAAAEVVAAALGRPLANLPEEATQWLGEHRDLPDNLVALATRAVTAVATTSELKELWEETADFDAWCGTVRDLQSRLAE